jgi:hypothetical protein
MNYDFYSMSTGGISNRLKIMSSLIRLAEKTKSNFFFYWPKNKLCNIAFKDLFQPINKEINKKEAKKVLKSKNKKYYEDELNFFDFPEKKKIIFSGWRFIFRINEPVPKSKDILFKGKKNLDYEFFNIPLNLRKDLNLVFQKFKPIPSLMSKINKFEKKENLSQTIGIHMRRGDFKESQEVSSDEKFLKKIEELLKISPKTRFFLCTDSKESEKIIRAKFGEKIIIYPKTNFDRLEKGFLKEGLIELFLLSKTKHIIGSYLSSFTEMAWWLGGCKAKIEILANEEDKKNTLKKKQIKIIPFLKRKIYNLITPLYKRILSSNI